MRSVWVLRHANQVQYVEQQMTTLFFGLYLHNRSSLDIGVLGYIGIFLTLGTLSRSFVHSAWDTLYMIKITHLAFVFLAL